MFLYATIYVLMSVANAAPQDYELAQYPTADKLLDSLLHLMEFFSSRYKQINLDGIFGIRITQSEVIRALAKIDNGEYSTASAEVKSKLEKIRDVANEICERAFPELAKQDEKYFAAFLPAIAKPWKILEFQPQRLRKMGEKFLPNRTLAESEDPSEFTEESSDECMQSMMGVDGRKCDVEKCWDMMTRRGTTLYFTTHQILYFQLGHQFGCQTHFERKATELGGLEKIFQGLCYNTIYQMETMFRHGKVKQSLQDIFIESGVVCGISGFMDALNITWLKEVLNWQDKKLGCFKDRFDGNSDLSFEADQRMFLQDLGYKKKEWRTRNLLYDVPMGDSCSSHKSGVAAGYLAVHVRLFFEQHVMKYRLPLHLQDANMWLLHESNDKYYPFSNLFYGFIMFIGICFFMIRSRRKLKVFSVFCT